MTQMEFDTGMGRLRDAYGDRAFGDTQVAIIWRMVKDLEAGDFAKIVTNIVMNRKTAPTPAEIRDHLRSYFDRIRDKRISEVLERTKEACTLCENTGSIVAEHVVSRHVYGFRCPCRLGSLLYGGCPEWNSDLLSQFAMTNSYLNESKLSEGKRQTVCSGSQTDPFE